MGFFKKIKEGFFNTHRKLWGGLRGCFQKTEHFSPEDWELLESKLYGADFGPEVVEQVVQKARNAKDKNPLYVRVRTILESLLEGSEGILPETKDPQILLSLGVNGAGKTTSIAKLAYYLQKKGSIVLLGSCDTFRAAADQQLKIWAERLHIDCVGSHTGADAAAVAHDTCQAGLSRHCNWILLDTAGRLHNKTHLMEELKKITRVVKKFNVTWPQHRWLVVDGSLGTNSIQQAKVFHEAVDLTGLVVTKLDGTSKGGALVGIYEALKVPIYFIGLGETCKDLQPFSKEAYLDAILGESKDNSSC